MHLFSEAYAVLFVIVIGLYFVYVFIHLLSWSILPYAGTQNFVSSPTTRISVIIAARNEEANITRCLNAISVQDYPQNLFEVIVVDDHSEDSTKVVAEKVLKLSAISYQLLVNSGKSKKGAIIEGIRNSTGELIVITDADCTSERTWLSTIEKAYKDTDAYMLCGPVKMDGERNFIEKFQGLELCGLSLLSGAGINLGYPLLCNGANIAYTRKVFEEVRGFEEVDGIPSGDDIFLMFKVHKMFPGKVAYIKSHSTFVTTSAQPTLKDFLSQRIRWASKGLYAKNAANKFVSLMVFAANFLCLISIPLLITLYSHYSAISYKLLAISLVSKLTSDFLLLFFATIFFKKMKLLWLFPVAELMTMLYTTWVGMTTNFTSYAWKGRGYKPQGNL